MLKLDLPSANSQGYLTDSFRISRLTIRYTVYLISGSNCHIIDNQAGPVILNDDVKEFIFTTLT